MASGYLFDGNDMKDTYGITVIKCSGILDFLKRKGETSHNWLDEDGEEAYTDSSDIYYEPRDIILDCIMIGTTRNNFASKHNAFRYILQSPGMHTFKTPYWSITHNVYFKDGGRVDMITPWESHVAAGATKKYIARFSITLREPEPMRPWA
jgi:hypothetical protein